MCPLFWSCLYNNFSFLSERKLKSKSPDGVNIVRVATGVDAFIWLLVTCSMMKSLMNSNWEGSIFIVNIAGHFPCEYWVHCLMDSYYIRNTLYVTWRGKLHEQKAIHVNYLGLFGSRILLVDFYGKSILHFFMNFISKYIVDMQFIYERWQVSCRFIQIHMVLHINTQNPWAFAWSFSINYHRIRKIECEYMSLRGKDHMELLFLWIEQ